MKCRGETCPTGMRLLLLGTAVLLTAARAQVDVAENEGWVRRLHAPSIVDPRNETVVLWCEYDLEDKELDTVTWWKNGKQLYRFMPSMETKGTSFPNESDVNVSILQSNDTHLVLRGHHNVTKNILSYGGTYFCEVLSKNPPSTGYVMANVSTAIVPREKPVIEGLAPHYHIGEQLEITCISAPSYPAAELTFYINGKKVDRGLKKKKLIPTYDYLTSTSVKMTHWLNRLDYRGESLTVGCRSTLPGVKLERDYITTATTTVTANNQRLEASYYNSAVSFAVSSLQPLLILLLLLLPEIFDLVTRLYC